MNKATTKKELIKYFKEHSREGDCPCPEHQAMIARWADDCLKIMAKEGRNDTSV